MAVLVDSSLWVHQLRKSGDPAKRDQVNALLERGVAAWCPPVRLELWRGAVNDAERKALRHYDALLPAFDISPPVWELAVRLADRGRAARITAPLADLLIFACAKIHGLDLVHDDAHFTQLGQLSYVIRVPFSTTSGRLAALAAATFIGARTMVDPDLWGHLKFGLDTLASGRLTAVDPYSFTQDVSWINHEWLSEVFQALAYRAGGVLGLLLMKSAVVIAAFAVLFAAARRAAEPARWWLLAAGIVAMAPAALTNRPQIWTLLLLAILLSVLEPSSPSGLPRASSPSSQFRLFILPLIFAVWANLHGGWIVGAGVAALWVAGRFIDTRSIRGILPAAIATAAGVVATAINPYGWRLWGFLASTVRVSRNITEWRPLWQQADASDAALWLLVAAGIVATTMLRRRRALTWAGTLPVVWLAVNSLLVARLVPLFGEVAVLNFAGAWQATAADSSTSHPDAAPRPAALVLIDAMLVAIVAASYLIAQAGCLTIGGPWAPDLAAAGAFWNPAIQGRLVLPFDWGEYTIWHFGPRLRVSMDGRRETVYTERTVDLQSAAAHGRPDGLEYLGRVRPEYVWLPASTGAPTAAWLRANGYRLDVDTRQSFIATRADLPTLGAGPPMSRCFP